MQQRPIAERPHSIEFAETGRTKQEFKEECDINHMIESFQRTGEVPAIQSVPGHFGDFSNVPDFHTAISRVRDAQAAFMQYPARIRARFENDPAQMIDFLEDPENELEAVELGLLEATPRPGGEEPPAPVPDPTNPEPPATDPPETGAEGEGSAT